MPIIALVAAITLIGAVTLDIDFGGGIVGFGEDAEGEIHIVTHWGTIAKIVPRG